MRTLKLVWLISALSLSAGSAWAGGYLFRSPVSGLLGPPSCTAAAQSFATPGVYPVTVPAGCATATVLLEGAGGGGGTYGYGGNGGKIVFTLPVTPGTSFNVSVGAGGSLLGALPEQVGNGGDSTSIYTGTTLTQAALLGIAGGGGGGASTGSGSYSINGAEGGNGGAVATAGTGAACSSVANYGEGATTLGPGAGGLVGGGNGSCVVPGTALYGGSYQTCNGSSWFGSIGNGGPGNGGNGYYGGGAGSAGGCYSAGGGGGGGSDWADAPGTTNVSDTVGGGGTGGMGGNTPTPGGPGYAAITWH